MASKRAVAGTWPSFLRTIGKIESLPSLVFLNLRIGVPSVSCSSGFSTYRVGRVPSPLSSNTSLPVLESGSPLTTSASKLPPYCIIAVGLKLTVTYLCLWGSMVTPSGSTAKANPSLLLLLDLCCTLNLTVHGILLGFMILNLSLAPSGFFEATSVPNQKMFSWIEKILELITVWVLRDGSREGITVCSSKIESTSLVLMPGIELSAQS